MSLFDCLQSTQVPRWFLRLQQSRSQYARQRDSCYNNSQSYLVIPYHAEYFCHLRCVLCMFAWFKFGISVFLICKRRKGLQQCEFRLVLNLANESTALNSVISIFTKSKEMFALAYCKTETNRQIGLYRHIQSLKRLFYRMVKKIPLNLRHLCVRSSSSNYPYSSRTKFLQILIKYSLIINTLLVTYTILYHIVKVCKNTGFKYVFFL